MCTQVCRVLACIDILPLFGAGNLLDCLYTVSDVDIEPLGLVLDVTEDDLRARVEGYRAEDLDLVLPIPYLRLGTPS